MAVIITAPKAFPHELQDVVWLTASILQKEQAADYLYAWFLYPDPPYFAKTKNVKTVFKLRKRKRQKCIHTLRATRVDLHVAKMFELIKSHVKIGDLLTEKDRDDSQALREIGSFVTQGGVNMLAKAPSLRYLYRTKLKQRWATIAQSFLMVDLLLRHHNSHKLDLVHERPGLKRSIWMLLKSGGHHDISMNYKGLQIVLNNNYL
jgi:hypothetical protein